MSKLYLMKGLPACGKSTRAKEMVQAAGNTVRVNKDLLRTMLHFDKFSGRNEGITSDAARALVRALLTKSNVIVDDTNLNPSVMQSWKDLGKECGANVEVVDMTNVPAIECIERDLARMREGQRGVGYPVIANMALRYGIYTPQPDSIVLCDIDGTIADISHRLHHVRSADIEAGTRAKDWKSFFAGIPDDALRQDVKARLDAYMAQGKHVIFLSARPDDHKEATINWLLDHRLPHLTVIMRRAGDHRPDVEVKLEMLNTYFPDRSAIHAILDDRPVVIRMWKEQGLPVIDVGQGVEF